METNKIYHEPCLDTLKRMPDNFIDCVITSPPYWQLRDYGYPEQWGLEPTFQEYLDHLWQLMDEIYRVLKNNGTVWVNLGDTYARGSRAKKASNNQTLRSNHEHLIEPNTKPDYEGLDKCLLLIPHRFAIGCIDRGWIIRNDIIWAKRNGMPESVTDRFTKKHEYIFFMVKQEKYYFDLDPIRDKHKWANDKRNDGNRHEYSNDVKSQDNKWLATNAVSFNEKGKNPGSVSDFWDITTKGSTNEHYAAYNDELIKKPILAGCPEHGIIYDPFMGTGSTAEAALRANRQFIGSEMSAKYCQIANNRLEPYLKQKTLF
jgi:site-specific DNA-methyltransferase (adenine-specific)